MEPALKEKYKGHARHELPNAASNMQVTNRSLAAHSPEYSVPLTAAVTYTLLMEFNLISCESLQIIVMLHGSQDYKFVVTEEFGIVSSYAPRTVFGDVQTMVVVSIFPQD